ncbi:hypothetical protein ACLMJK_006499 [Lecanora helva]
MGQAPVAQMLPRPSEFQDKTPRRSSAPARSTEVPAVSSEASHKPPRERKRKMSETNDDIIEDEQLSCRHKRQKRSHNGSNHEGALSDGNVGFSDQVSSVHTLPPRLLNRAKSIVSSGDPRTVANVITGRQQIHGQERQFDATPFAPNERSKTQMTVDERCSSTGSSALPEDRRQDTMNNQTTSQRLTEPVAATTTEPVVKIRYYIIISRSPHLNKLRWPDFGLNGKSLNTLLNEVSEKVSAESIQIIRVTLDITGKETHTDLARNQNELFEDMKDDFSQKIVVATGEGIWTFAVVLEAHPLTASTGHKDGPQKSEAQNLILSFRI